MPRDALVVRFSPMGPDRMDKLRDQALEEFEYSGRYGLSVFAAAPRPGEDRRELLIRIGEAAFADGLKKIKDGWCSTPDELRKKRLKLRADAPPDEHYSVDLRFLSDDELLAFISAFGNKERMPK